MPKNKNLDKLVYIAKKFCSKGEKCSFDVMQKLDHYKISHEQKLIIIEELKKEKFLDEDRYTKAYVNDKFKFNKWGKVKIFHALKNKNINESLINKYIEAINTDDYLQTLKELLLQKRSTIKKEADPHKIKASLVRFASGRGFEYELIMNALKDIRI